jgi:hypothetical protein
LLRRVRGSHGPKPGHLSLPLTPRFQSFIGSRRTEDTGSQEWQKQHSSRSRCNVDLSIPCTEPANPSNATIAGKRLVVDRTETLHIFGRAHLSGLGCPVQPLREMVTQSKLPCRISQIGSVDGKNLVDVSGIDSGSDLVHETGGPGPVFRRISERPVSGHRDTVTGQASVEHSDLLNYSDRVIGDVGRFSGRS